MNVSVKHIEYLSIREIGALSVLVILHLVGLLGIGIFQSNDIVNLSWANLAVSFLIGALFFRKRSTAGIFWFGVIFCIGFFSEFIGVNTGLLFGDYTYGTVLGVKFWGVPVIIGLLWFTLSIGAKNLVSRITGNKILIALFASVLMVGFDLLMEPVAIDLEFWTWANDTIPVLNYISWFFVALLIQFLIRNQSTNNRVYEGAFVIQMLFFIGLNFML